MSKGVVCEAGCHPITFATQKSLNNTENAITALLGKLCVCEFVAMRDCVGMGFNAASKS